MDQARVEIADVAEVDVNEFFVARVQREQLKIGSRRVEPRHALGGGSPRTRRNDDLETAEVAAALAVFAAIVEPEDPEGENAVDHAG